MTDFVTYMVTAIGGGGLGAVLMALFKRDERIFSLMLADTSKTRNMMWQKMVDLQTKCEEQDEELRILLARAQESEQRYLTLIEELRIVKSSIPPRHE